MTFVGVFLNAFGVLVAGVFGGVLKRGVPEKLKSATLMGLGMCMLYIGVSGVTSETDVVVLLISVTVGALVGNAIDLDQRLRQLGSWMQRALPGKDDNVADAFVTSTLVVCAGALSIVGGIESGTQGTYSTFAYKTIIDFLLVFFLATSKGMGCSLSAVVTFVYQGAITLFAGWIATVVNDVVISQMSQIGSLLIIGIGLNQMNVTNIKLANFILSPFVPVLLFVGQSAFGQISGALT